MSDKKTNITNQDNLSYEILLKAVEYHRVISNMQKKMYSLLLRGELDRNISTAVFLVADAFEMALMCAQREEKTNAQSCNKPT